MCGLDPLASAKSKYAPKEPNAKLKTTMVTLRCARPPAQDSADQTPSARSQAAAQLAQLEEKSSRRYLGASLSVPMVVANGTMSIDLEVYRAELATLGIEEHDDDFDEDDEDQCLQYRTTQDGDDVSPAELVELLSSGHADQQTSDAYSWAPGFERALALAKEVKPIESFAVLDDETRARMEAAAASGKLVSADLADADSKRGVLMSSVLSTIVSKSIAALDSRLCSMSSKYEEIISRTF